MSLDFTIQPHRWGICLFSFNVMPQVLNYYNATGDVEPALDMLRKGIEKGRTKYITDFNLLGIHDYISIFKADPCYDRHGVVEEIALWAQRFSSIKDRSPTDNILSQAYNQVWNDLLTNMLPDKSKLEKIIQTILDEFPQRKRKYKVPTLYNYSHEVLIPLYPDSPDELEERITKARTNHCTQSIIAFSFLRVDPRVMGLCNPNNHGMPDCWAAYNVVREFLEAREKFIVGIWAGLGISQLVVMWQCRSILDLYDDRAGLRNCVVQGPSNRRYTVLSSSSTLLSISKDINTVNTSFSILIRLCSGFHGREIWKKIRNISEICNLEEIDIGERQGFFDVIVTVKRGTPYNEVYNFVRLLNCICSFVEDIATIMKVQEE